MKHFGLQIVALMCALGCWAQSEEPRLHLPATPAFSIVNLEPAAVLKPTTAKALAADVLNAFDKNGKLLLNLGLEVSPYWLQSRPTLTREQYLRPSLGQRVIQSLSLSAATAKDSANGATKLGTGFRFKLLNGEPVADLAKAEQQLIDQESITNALAMVRASIGSGAIKTREAAIEQLLKIVGSTVPGNTPPTPEEARRLRQMARQVAEQYTDGELALFIDQLTLRQVASYDSLANRVSELTYLRKGWIAEVAGAAAFNMARGNNLDRAGVWGTLSNYVSTSDLFSFSARYMWRHIYDTSVSNLDAGLAYLKQAGTFNFSAEAVLRYYLTEAPAYDFIGRRYNKSDSKLTYRLAVQASYALNRDLSLNLSLGKGIEDAFATTSGFFSLLGVNYSVFRKEQVRL